MGNPKSEGSGNGPKGKVEKRKARELGKKKTLTIKSQRKGKRQMV